MKWHINRPKEASPFSTFNVENGFRGDAWFSFRHFKH
jgi:hypothetical protein